MSGAAIALREVAFRYRTRTRPAIQGISLEIDAGETLLVLGPSGSGKSTLALCLNGLIPHHVTGDLSGSVMVDGRDTRSAEPAWIAQTVGMVFQDPDAQLCQLIAEDEVAFGLENVGVPRDAMRPRVDAALESVGLGGMGKVRVDRLSGGQKQRLTLAAVLAMEPRVLVFDEPTAHLDPLAARELFGRVGRLRGKRTVVIVEHRVEEALALADRVLVLGADGAPVALGTPERVLRDHWDELSDYGVHLPAALDVRRERRRPTGEAAVRVSGLRFAYVAGAPVLRDVTCTVPAGVLTVVVGPNGSGKSTLVSHFAGIHRSERGAVTVLGRDGRELVRRPRPEEVGYVFQNPEHQFLTTRVFDEVAWGLRRLKLPEETVKARVAEELAAFGLDHLAEANPFALSGGEKRRLSLATALVLGPRLLILDEPTFGQDAHTTAALFARFEELFARGGTIVAVTHDVRLLAENASHVILLVQGRVAFEGRPEALLADESLRTAGRLVLPEAAQPAGRSS